MFSILTGSVPPLSSKDEQELCILLYHTYHFSQERIAEFLGRSQSWVSKVCQNRFAVTIDGNPPI